MRCLCGSREFFWGTSCSGACSPQRKKAIFRSYDPAHHQIQILYREHHHVFCLQFFLEWCHHSILRVAHMEAFVFATAFEFILELRTTVAQNSDGADRNMPSKHATTSSRSPARCDLASGPSASWSTTFRIGLCCPFHYGNSRSSTTTLLNSYVRCPTVHLLLAGRDLQEHTMYWADA